MTPPPVIRLHPDDGVLIARSSLPPGMVVADGVTTVERIPAGHKVAIKPIAMGEPRTMPMASTSSRCRISICLRPSRASAVPTAVSRRATISAFSPR